MKLLNSDNVFILSYYLLILSLAISTVNCVFNFEASMKKIFIFSFLSYIIFTIYFLIHFYYIKTVPKTIWNSSSDLSTLKNIDFIYFLILTFINSLTFILKIKSKKNTNKKDAS